MIDNYLKYNKFAMSRNTINIYFPAFNEVEPILRANGYSDENLMVRIFPGEDHNETCWAKRVEIPIRWAFR